MGNSFHEKNYIQIQDKPIPNTDILNLEKSMEFMEPIDPDCCICICELFDFFKL
jgi:hypothetical protein